MAKISIFVKKMAEKILLILLKYNISDVFCPKIRWLVPRCEFSLFFHFYLDELVYNFTAKLEENDEKVKLAEIFTFKTISVTENRIFCHRESNFWAKIYC